MNRLDPISLIALSIGLATLTLNATNRPDDLVIPANRPVVIETAPDLVDGRIPAGASSLRQPV